MGSGTDWTDWTGRVGRVGRVDIDFLTGPEKTGVFNKPSTELVAEKLEFGSSRYARWFKD